MERDWPFPAALLYIMSNYRDTVGIRHRGHSMHLILASATMASSQRAQTHLLEAAHGLKGVHLAFLPPAPGPQGLPAA